MEGQTTKQSSNLGFERYVLLKFAELLTKRPNWHDFKTKIKWNKIVSNKLWEIIRFILGIYMF